MEEVLEFAKAYFGDSLRLTYPKESQEFESQALGLDPSSAIARLAWQPIWNQKEAIDRTFLWWMNYLDNPNNALNNCLEDISISLEVMR